MDGWVTVRAGGIADQGVSCAPWVERALNFAETLSPKQPSARASSPRSGTRPSVRKKGLGPLKGQVSSLATRIVCRRGGRGC